MVKFILECRTPVGRIGQVSEWGSFAFQNSNHETPSFMVYTRIGHIPHLTWDVVKKFLKFLQIPILQFNLPLLFDDLASVETFGHGIARFCSTPSNYPIHLSIRDPLGRQETGHNNSKSMAIWVRGGRTSISPENLRDIVSTCMPHSFSTLVDYDTPKESKNKRLAKSVLRTTEWYKKTFKENEPLHGSAIVGLCGGFSTFHRVQLAKNLLENFNSNGFSIDLFPFSKNKNIQSNQEFDEIEISKLISPVISELPESKIRIVDGAFDPNQIWYLTGLGVDLFDSSYAVQLAEEFKGLKISNDFPKSVQFTVVDFNDSSYAENFTPVFEGCSCYTCTHYTKAYVQHLANTKEMLGYSLLVIHNLTEFDRMFSLIRSHLKELNSNI